MWRSMLDPSIKVIIGGVRSTFKTVNRRRIKFKIQRTFFVILSFYYDIPITRMLPGNHPSRQPSASLRSKWVTELAWHVQLNHIILYKDWLKHPLKGSEFPFLCWLRGFDPIFNTNERFTSKKNITSCFFFLFCLNNNILEIRRSSDYSSQFSSFSYEINFFLWSIINLRF